MISYDFSKSCDKSFRYLKTFEADEHIPFLEINGITETGIYRLYLEYDQEKILSNQIQLICSDNIGNEISKRFINSNKRNLLFFVKGNNNIDSILFSINGLKEKSISLFNIEIEEIDDSFLHIKSNFHKDGVYASLATYPPRRNMLSACVNRLTHQFDKVYIYLNQYLVPPKFLIDLREKGKVEYILDPSGEMRASGKFYWCHNPGYHFLCDDDILYPGNYCDFYLNKLSTYNNEAIVGSHALLLSQEGIRIRDEQVRFGFRDRLNKDTPVSVLGTGTIAFHSDTVKDFDFSKLFLDPIANDELFAVLAKRNNIPLISIERKHNWIKSNPKMKFGIFEEKAIFKNRRRNADGILTKEAPWPSYYVLNHKALFIRRNENVTHCKNGKILSKLRSLLKELDKIDRVKILQLGACDGISFDPLYDLIKQNLYPCVLVEPIDYLFNQLISNYSFHNEAITQNIAITENTGYSIIRYVAPNAILADEVPDWSIGLGTLKKDVNALDGKRIPEETHLKIQKHIIEQKTRTVAFDEFVKRSYVKDCNVLVSDCEGYDLYLLKEALHTNSNYSIILGEILLLEKNEIEDLISQYVAAEYDIYFSHEYFLAFQRHGSPSASGLPA